jgi:hypothetical protein
MYFIDVDDGLTLDVLWLAAGSKNISLRGFGFLEALLSSHQIP